MFLWINYVLPDVLMKESWLQVHINKGFRESYCTAQAPRMICWEWGTFSSRHPPLLQFMSLQLIWQAKGKPSYTQAFNYAAQNVQFKCIRAYNWLNGFAFRLSTWLFITRTSNDNTFDTGFEKPKILMSKYPRKEDSKCIMMYLHCQ